MSESLDHALDSFLGAICVVGDLVADLDDGAPVLGGEVLVGRLGYGTLDYRFRRSKTRR
jgi:hypothetical protein